MLLLIFGAGFFVGLAVILLGLGLVKKLKWRWAASLLVVSLLLALGCLGGVYWVSRPSPTADNGEYTTKFSRPRVYQLQKQNQVHTGDDELALQTNAQGQYVLHLKGLANGTVQLKDDDDESNVRFKTQRLSLKKGQVTKLTITLPASEDQHQFELVDSFGHDTDFQLVRPAAPTTSSTSDWESK